ncbi:hypothetical protein FHS20_003569 [Phyllobacterium endophyticum]|uniref:Uncharacterized protein n=1 Tax=Phyllobacterium endophyticum TaxID=1149773 RepID=A0A2P7ARW6_9HYPH|nr:hypothetical protein [Phyllobacterium endophyticum]PSH56971.1 hypothetical protein CU100_16915 [Phyllobacterium endophyticum]
MAVADGTVQLKNVDEDAAGTASIFRLPVLLNPARLSSRTIFTLMIALFLPTGNHVVEKTVTLTNRYTNTYFCTYKVQKCT